MHSTTRAGSCLPCWLSQAVECISHFYRLMAKKIDKSPAFQFYPDKWESHTAHLSDYAYRIYHRIICWMWQHSNDKCSIKADAMAISTVLAEPIDRIESAMGEINNKHMPLLKKRGEKFFSNGLKKEAKKQKIRRKKASESAKARWNKDLEDNKPDANASPKHSSPSPSPIPSPSLVSKDINKKGATQTDSELIHILLKIFTDSCPSLPAPQGKLSKPRQSAMRLRYKELGTLADWEDFCKRIEASDFLAGRTDRPFSCGIDWVLKPANFAKIIEGNFDNKKPNQPDHHSKYSDKNRQF